MADEFMKQSGDVQVEIQNIPEDGFSEKISAMIASDTGPDVWVWFYATDIARRGFIEELTPFMERDGVKPEELWFSICLARATYQDKIYSVPRDGVWALIGYNQTLFEEMGAQLPTDGWTLEDYLTACQTLTSEEKVCKMSTTLRRRVRRARRWASRPLRRAKQACLPPPAGHTRCYKKCPSSGVLFRRPCERAGMRSSPGATRCSIICGVAPSKKKAPGA
jgi:hypothetical protein